MLVSTRPRQQKREAKKQVKSDYRREHLHTTVTYVRTTACDVVAHARIARAIYV